MGLAKLTHSWKPNGPDITKSIKTPARHILGLAVAAILGAVVLPATAMDASNTANASRVISTLSRHDTTGPQERPISTYDEMRCETLWARFRSGTRCRFRRRFGQGAFGTMAPKSQLYGLPNRVGVWGDPSLTM